MANDQDKSQEASRDKKKTEVMSPRAKYMEMPISELVELFAAKPALMVGLLVSLLRKQSRMQEQFNAAWFRFVNHGHSPVGNCVIPAIEAPVCSVGAVERSGAPSFKEFLVENLLWCEDKDCSGDDPLDFDFDSRTQACGASSRPRPAF